MGLDFGELFKNSWNEYWKNFKTILVAYWWFVILFAIIVNAASFLFFSDDLLGAYTASTPSMITGNSILTGMSVDNLASFDSTDYVYSTNYVIFLVVTAIISTILSAFLYLTLLYFTLYGSNGMSFSKAVRGGKSFFWKMVGLVVIGSLAAFACFLPFFVALIMGFGTGLISPILSGITAVLAIALFIGGFIFLIYLAVSWIFSFYVLMRENTGIIESLRRSRIIVKGNWWKVFGYYLLLSLILTGISIVFGIPKLIGLVFAMIFGANLTSLIFNTAVNFIFSTAATIIVTPLALFFLKNFYLGLTTSKASKNRK